MINGALKAGVQQVLGEGVRVFQVLSIVASIAAAAWYLEDRRTAAVTRESSAVEAKLNKLDERMDARIAELSRAVDAVNRRLDRVLEMQLSLSARRER